MTLYWIAMGVAFAVAMIVYWITWDVRRRP